MKLLDIDNLKANLGTGEYGECMNDYRDCSSYVCDAISEIADNHTSIYYSDIKEFISNNVDAVERALDEFGWEGVGGDLMKAGQMGEYLEITDDLYSHLADSLKLVAYDFCKYDCKLDAIPEELDDIICGLADEEDNNARMSLIPDAIREWLTGSEDAPVSLTSKENEINV